LRCAGCDRRSRAYLNALVIAMSNWLAGPFQHFLEPLSVPAELDFNGPRCAHVRQFFKKFDLDPNNLRHWHLLIWDLAGKPRGRPSKWKKLEELYVLRLQVDLMKHADPAKDDAQCCIELTKKKGKNKKVPYPNLKPKTLERRLRDARKPEHALPYKGFVDMLRRAQLGQRKRP
jgi:hypothetical protein